VERKLMFSKGDVRTYTTRALAHRGDEYHRGYVIQTFRERAWLSLVWRPLARLVGLSHDIEDRSSNLASAGQRSVAEWLDTHPYLSIAGTGGYRCGQWVEWFSIDPAPWSGRREDWLLWTDGEGHIDVDGPMSSYEAQVIYDDFDAEVMRLDQLAYESWKDPGYEDWEGDSHGWYDYTPPAYVQTDTYANAPFVGMEETKEAQELLDAWRAEMAEELVDDDEEWDRYGY